MVLQGMGDDFPVGYSLNQGGWGWGGFGGNFQMDLSNLFAITMANFRFPNFTGGGSMWNGFIGGGMGAGMGNFQMSPYGGAEYNFSTSGSSSSGSTKKTAEEKKAEALAKDSLKDKHKALIDLLTKYLNTLDKNSDEYKSLHYDLTTGYKAVKQENYDKLKEYYNNKENNKKIKTALNKTDDWKKNVVLNTGNSYLGKTSGWLTTDVLDGESLKSDVDVMDLMELLNTKDTGWFTRGPEQKKVNKAIWKALKAKVDSVKSNSALSADTKAALEKAAGFCNENADFGANRNGHVWKSCCGMYYWLRIANAEIYANKYACLSEDFSGDALLGKDAIINAAKDDLYKTEHFSKDGYCAKQKYD